MKNNESLEEIFKLVRNGEASPEEALQYIKEQKNKKDAESAKSELKIQPLYFSNEWKLKGISKDIKASYDSRPLLVFGLSNKYKQTIENRYKSKGYAQSVITIESSNEYETESSGDKYTLNIQQETDYMTLIQDLRSRNKLPGNIVFSWSNPTDNSEEQLLKGILALASLVKALDLIEINHNVKILFIYQNGQPSYEAIGGFAKSLLIEKPNIVIKTVNVCQENKNESEIPILPDIILEELWNIDYDQVEEVKYESNKRFTKTVTEITDITDITGQQANIEFREKGVYVITGGVGGLGYILAEYLAKEYKAKITLNGRAALNDDILEKLKRLTDLGAEVSYISADVSIREDAFHLIEKTRNYFGKINGIIHAAGIVNDGQIVKKTWKSLQEVLAPKVNGVVNIDFASQNEELDFLISFSSISAITGNPGQCDYAYANAFLNSFSEWRALNGHSGKTLSINWPLWKDGGMAVNIQSERLVSNTVGLHPLTSQDGLSMLLETLKFPGSHVIVASGNSNKIRRFLLKKETKNIVENNRLTSSEYLSDTSDMWETFKKEILLTIAKIINIDEEDIDYDSILSEVGFDSITYVELANKISENFGLEISPSLFYGNPTPDSIAAVLYEEQEQILKQYYKNLTRKNNSLPIKEENRAGSSTEIEEEVIPIQKLNIEEEIEKAYVKADVTTETNRNHNSVCKEPIAIIGISGRMPQSENVEEFWENLEKERDLITEIDKSRWDWEEYYGDPRTEYRKTNIKWGGFMSEVDKFDPRFFNISTRDAEFMDPQERISMEEVWSCIEDAGYNPSNLSGSKTALFIGVGNADYKELLMESNIPAIMSQWKLTNQISYNLNLKGPSEPVDTACSSSLVSIHRAVECIQNGSCEMAIAGGVNVIVSPNSYFIQSSAGMLSEDGRCKTFDTNANGYVRGEGVGMLFLKPLSKAVKDKDHIYAVIKGSAVNHGGFSNGFTVPNPNSQAELLMEAYGKSGIDPSTISYIEAHGTGTKLGDPVEVDALKLAFKKLYNANNKQLTEKSRCWLGSVKTNIGHLEFAAGIAGVLKVIMSLKNNKLPASLHCKEINPYIQLKNSPFSILTETIPWNHLKDGEGKKIPRRAGVSSFGIGGVNAHIVLEEYIGPEHEETTHLPQVITISAKNREQLQVYVQKMIKFLRPLLTKHQEFEATDIQENIMKIVSNFLDISEKEIAATDVIGDLGIDPLGMSKVASRIKEIYQIEHAQRVVTTSSTFQSVARSINKYLNKDLQTPLEEDGNKYTVSLASIAYTLQTGRESMGERLAIVVSNIEELYEKLNRFFQGEKKIETLYYGEKATTKNEIINWFEKDDLEDFTQVLIQKKKVPQLAKLWARGLNIPWEQVYSDEVRNRVPLPTYPFAKQRYWIPDLDKENTMNSKNSIVRINSKEISGENQGQDNVNTRFNQEVIQTLSQILKDSLTVKDLESSAFELGFDSLKTVEFYEKMNHVYGFKINAEDFFRHHTLKEFIDEMFQNNQDSIYLYYEHLSEEKKVTIKDDNMLKTDEVLSHEGKIANVSSTTLNKNIEILGISKYNTAEFLNYWKRIKDNNYTLTPKNNVLQDYLQKIKKNEKKIVHLLVEGEKNDKMEVLISGKGKPILLITGFALTGSQFYYQIKEWSPNYQLIMIHLPGCGLSKSDTDLTIPGISKKFVNVLNKLGINVPYHIVATSWGGLIGQTIAKEYPDQVKSLTLVSSFCNGVKDLDVKEKLKKDFELIDGLNDFEIVENSNFVNPSITNYFEQLGDQVSTSDIVSEIKIPTLVIAGGRDTIVDRKEFEYLYSSIQNSEYFEIDGAGHAPFITNHKEFNEKVLQFITRTENVNKKVKR
ncbi:alpha/beta fold hydrolase [Fictibacillus phosphorivorans]|uniref:alpha/beta fold hydrolase n=1 Tax=Fictibacillus phosphorivorans TaxID=1221500 RepID=UPI003CE9FF51